LHLLTKDGHSQKIIEELETDIVRPHYEAQGKVEETWEPSKIVEMMTLEKITELNYFGSCFYESLRMQPPVPLSSTACMSADVVAGGMSLRKGDAFNVDMYRLCNNPVEWQ
jgi:cytochrome P450